MASIEVDVTIQLTLYKRENVTDEEAVREASESMFEALKDREGEGFSYDDDVLESMLVTQEVGENIILGSDDLN